MEDKCNTKNIRIGKKVAEGSNFPEKYISVTA